VRLDTTVYEVHIQILEVSTYNSLVLYGFRKLYL